MKHTHKLIFQRENIHRAYEKFMHFSVFCFSLQLNTQMNLRHKFLQRYLQCLNIECQMGRLHTIFNYVKNMGKITWNKKKHTERFNDSHTERVQNSCYRSKLSIKTEHHESYANITEWNWETSLSSNKKCESHSQYQIHSNSANTNKIIAAAALRYFVSSLSRAQRIVMQTAMARTFAFSNICSFAIFSAYFCLL